MLIGFVVVFWILRELSSLILPFALALFTVMLLQPLLAFLIRKKVPSLISVTLVSIFTLLLVAIFVSIVSSTAAQVADNSKLIAFRFDHKLEIFLQWTNSHLNFQLNPTQVRNFIAEPFKGDWLARVLGDLALFLGSMTGSFLMFSIYFVILLSGIMNYEKYIHYVFGEKSGLHFVKEFENTIKAVSSYVGMKFLISFVTGFCFWVICTGFGVRFALFWGFLAFVLNFIPNIGSIIATILPILLGIIYLESGTSIVIYSSLLILTEFIIGNILDPILMGNRMNLNTLTVLLGLVFWGYIWGVAGMLLSVPLMVLLRIVLEQNPDTALIARAMISTKRLKLDRVEDPSTQEAL